MRLFQRCGLKCFAFTAKHHDGFSMWDTKTRVKRRVNWTAPGGPKIEECDLAYSIMETPLRRDVVRELSSGPSPRDCDRPLLLAHRLVRRRFSHGPLESLCGQELHARKRSGGLCPVCQRHRGQIREILSNHGPVDMVCLDMELPGFCWPEVKRDRALGPPAAARRALPGTRHRGLRRLHDAGELGASRPRADRQAGRPALDGDLHTLRAIRLRSGRIAL